MKRSTKFIFAGIDSVASLLIIFYSLGNALGLPAMIFGIITLLLTIYSVLSQSSRTSLLSYISASTMLAFGSFTLSYVEAARYFLYGGNQNFILGILCALAGVAFIVLDVLYAGLLTH
jgi:hypothetical protein